eukprot:6177758-Pleurochrysis_carterae.AAC.1
MALKAACQSAPSIVARARTRDAFSCVDTHARMNAHVAAHAACSHLPCALLLRLHSCSLILPSLP